MQSVNVDQLKLVIDSQHVCKSTFIQTVCVSKWNGHPNSWDGLVHVFNVTGHPVARRAYAWASPIAGSGAPRYFAVLHQGRVRSPADAVKAAVSAIQSQAQPTGVAAPRPACIIDPLLLAAAAR